MAPLQADGYRPLGEAALIEVLASIPMIAERLGGDPNAWSVESLSGGNLNRIFAVTGSIGSVCTKQALPYMRLLGPGAPMPLDRVVFEQRTRKEHARFVPDRVPVVHHFDPSLRLVVMEFLSGHRELRRALIDNRPLPLAAAHLGEYIADVLFRTSALTLSAAECRGIAAAMAGNAGMYKFLEDLVFTEPYMDHTRNTWNAPHLDEIARAFHTDAALKVAVGRLKHRFMSAGEALLHGDLHTGSVLVTDEDTRMIDFELSLYGPWGYDLGTLLAHTFMNFFGQDGMIDRRDQRRAGQLWTIGFVAEVWQRFTGRFAQLWGTERCGEAYPADWFGGDAAADRAALDDLLRTILADALGFCGTEMIRRIIGLAQVDDLEQIEDPQLRARYERRALSFARQLILGAAGFEDMIAVCKAAEALRTEP